LTVGLLNFGNPLGDALEGAPNPKPTASDKARFGKLASLYTAFSEDFAEYALEYCERAGCTRIVDPFGGMGTVANAGRSRPLKLLVGDISPFAALCSAFRSAPQDIVFEGAELVDRLARKTGAANERDLYSQLITSLSAHTKSSIASILRTPSVPKHRAAAVAMFVAALSRIHLHKHLAGSNPTWIKRPDAVADRDTTLKEIRAAQGMVCDFANHLRKVHPSNRTESDWSDIDELPVVTGRVDAILTSPPYANRTDYIRHYLPASELLLTAANRDERLTRAKQIGTPLIRDTMPRHDLPKRVKRLLAEIKNHKSYASERYYYKGFLYYFADMHDALVRMRRWLRKDGLLLMVVQDTYYKEVQVPTADLLTDIAVAIGFKEVARRDWSVSQRLSQLSPHTWTLPKRTLRESVVVLSR
jgi:hypothetical protein